MSVQCVCSTVPTERGGRNFKQRLVVSEPSNGSVVAHVPDDLVAVVMKIRVIGEQRQRRNSVQPTAAIGVRVLMRVGAECNLLVPTDFRLRVLGRIDWELRTRGIERIVLP